MKCFLVGYRGTCHLSLVFSSYTHSPKGSCVYAKKKSDAWHIPRYPTRKHCITSMYCIVLYCIVLHCILSYCYVVYYTVLH